MKIVGISTKKTSFWYNSKIAIFTLLIYKYRPISSLINTFSKIFIKKSLKKILTLYLDTSSTVVFKEAGHIEILKSNGIRNTVLQVFDSYLFKNKKHILKPNAIYSDYKELEAGVPQGTVLWPIRYTVYINSLLNLK